MCTISKDKSDELEEERNWKQEHCTSNSFLKIQAENHKYLDFNINYNSYHLLDTLQKIGIPSDLIALIRCILK